MIANNEKNEKRGIQPKDGLVVGFLTEFKGLMIIN